MPEFDVLVVGSGPAGVSAAFPLVQAGLRVAMADGGQQPTAASPDGSFLEARHKFDQNLWSIGNDFHAFRVRDVVSPKLRAASQAYAFAGFAQANQIEADGCVAVGSLAVGGLSNAWGCGVARVGAREANLPMGDEAMEASYEAVARRIGLSGAVNDDLSDYFGVDQWLQPPLPLDGSHAQLAARYARRAPQLRTQGFRLGRSRVAVLSADEGERLACNLSANCLFGCVRESMYSAAQDVARLRQHANFSWLPGLVVREFRPLDVGQGWTVLGERYGLPERRTAYRVLLAAGTLATTALALRTLGHTQPVRLQTSPTAAFLLWLPRRLGAAREAGFGLGQLSYTVSQDRWTAFGSTFATTGLPLWEFASRLPLSRGAGMRVLSHLLSSCLVGNVFLPGGFSQAEVKLQPDGSMRVQAQISASAQRAFVALRPRIAGSFRAIGAVMLPASFTVGRAGSDIHYAGTLPMAHEPTGCQTDALGQLPRLPGLHAVDGACLPSLPEKSHTLFLMANADRIGRALASNPS